MNRVVSDFDEFMTRKTHERGKTPVYFISLKPSKLCFGELSLQTQVNTTIRKRAEQRSDCAAVPENLWESELFGAVRGAFTGAEKDRAVCKSM